MAFGKPMGKAASVRLGIALWLVLLPLSNLGGSAAPLAPTALTQIWTYSPVATWSVMGGKGPAVADLEGNGSALEIVIGSSAAAGGGIVILNSSGGLKKSIATRAHIRATPTLADLDKNGDLEIIALTESYGTNWVQVFHHTGALAWEKKLDPRDLNHDGNTDADANRDNCIDGSSVCVSVYDARYLALNPATGDWQIGECGGDCGVSPKPGEIEFPHLSAGAADVDGDGSLEVFVGVSIRYNFGNYSHSPSNPAATQMDGNDHDAYDGLVYGWNHDGTNLAGWPFYDHFGIGSKPAFGDVDGDGKLDVVFTSDADRIYAIRHNGDVIPAWGHGNSGQVRGAVVNVHPSVADMDGDGRAEVALTNWVNPDFTNPEHVPGFALFDAYGVRIAGTPITWTGYESEIANQYHTYSPELTPAIVDVNGDGAPEIITPGTDKKVHFFQWDGVQFSERSGWPKSLGDFMAAEAVVGDVNRDGQVDVVVTTYDHKKQGRGGRLIGWTLDGTELFNLAVANGNGFKGPAALADIDQDGNLEIVASGEDGVVRAYRFSSSGSTPAVLWSQHHGNAAHSGRMIDPPANRPRGIAADAGATAISLSWGVGSSSSITGYKVFRRAWPSGGEAPVSGTLAANTLWYVDNTVTAGTLYVYRIAAVVGGNNILSAPFAVQADTDGNLVVNSGFEARLDHWDFVYGDWPAGYSLPIEATDQVHSGARSLKINLTGSGGGLQRPRQYRAYLAPEANRKLVLTPGQQYILSGWIRATGLNSETARLTLRVADVYDPSTVNHFVPTNFATIAGGSTNGWQQVSVTFTAPAWADESIVYPNIIRNGATTGSVWFDDIALRLVNQPTPTPTPPPAATATPTRTPTPTSTPMPPTQYVPLIAGWNLVSLPVQPSNTSVSALVAAATPAGSVTDVWAFDNCNGQVWRKYPAGPGDSALASVNHTMGLWVHASQPAQLTVQGTLPSTTNISLCAGANLVGFPDNAPRAVDAKLAGKPVERAAGYSDSGEWQVWRSDTPPYGDSLSQFAPKRGYWLQATSNATWTVGPGAP